MIRKVIVDCGAIDVVLKAMKVHHQDSQLQANAFVFLARMAPDEFARQAIGNAGGIETVQWAINHGKNNEDQGFDTLFSLLLEDDDEDLDEPNSSGRNKAIEYAGSTGSVDCAKKENGLDTLFSPLSKDDDDDDGDDNSKYCMYDID